MSRLPLEVSQPWRLIRSPKLRPADRRGVYSWSNHYTAFSEDFAAQAIGLLDLRGSGPILDIFCGSGTTLHAAAKLGRRAIGVDLDPFAALLARAAGATAADLDQVTAYLSASPADSPSESTFSNLFASADLAYAQRIVSRLVEGTGLPRPKLLRRVLRDPTGRYDSEAVALAAIALGAERSAKLVKGSNPVWNRRPAQGELRSPRSHLSTLSPQLAQSMLVDIAKLDVKLKCRNTVLINDDFRRVRLRDHHYSGFVTSPPYLNRLDYVVSHLGPISLLSTIFTIDADDLRRSMMGTTKMVEKRDPDPSFGPLCLATLEQIKTHTSKASSTYYYWFYVKYFRDLREALCTLQRCCVSGAQGVVVLQNSYYKDVLVPVPEILVELATLLNLRAVVVRDHIIRTHLGVLDPSQKKYVPSKTLKESVVRIEVAGQ